MSTALARKFRVDVSADLTLATGFVQLNGISDFDPEVSPNLVDSSAYDTSGWSSSEITMQAWVATATYFRRLLAGTYDPGQELVRARVGQFGDSARIAVRWYDKNGGPEAGRGVALVTTKRSSTAVKDLEQVQATFTGTDIPLQTDALGTFTNPGTAPVAAVVLSATPSAVAVGGIVEIVGVNFTGATGVKFNAVNATSYIVVSDNVIVAVMPAGTAGSAPIIVTNPVGASNALPYTRGA